MQSLYLKLSCNAISRIESQHTVELIRLQKSKHDADDLDGQPLQGAEVGLKEPLLQVTVGAPGRTARFHATCRPTADEKRVGMLLGPRGVRRTGRIWIYWSHSDPSNLVADYAEEHVLPGVHEAYFGYNGHLPADAIRMPTNMGTCVTKPRKP